jgi:hypothetical protein
MISVTILIAALLVAMMTYNGLFASAVDYDRNRQVSNKAIDIMNTICLSPGSPLNWGQTNEPLLGFGLQDPDVGGYALSPYSVMKLKTASNENQLVEYPKDSSVFYNNISTNYGDAILTPIDNCVNYTTAAELLGINGIYGFGVDITPTFDVEVKENSTAPNLKLNVRVSGSGMPLSGAALKYYLFHVENGTPFPSITINSSVDEIGPSGSVDINFSSIPAGSVYAFVVYVSLGGANGVGYISNRVDDDTFIVPLIDGYEDGYLNLILAHSGEILNPSENATAYYNASFYTLTSDFHLQRVEIENSTGVLKAGTEQICNTTQIPASETGILVISYADGGALGTVMMPCGAGALGVSALYDNGLGSVGYDFVATELRQVKIDEISYQVKVSTWSLGD